VGKKRENERERMNDIKRQGRRRIWEETEKEIKKITK